jgi:hypothetical protein
MIQFVIWPDGHKRLRPNDGTRFSHNGETYTWDDAIGLWVNSRGEIVRFEEKERGSTHPSLDGYYGYTIDDLSELLGLENEKKKAKQTNAVDENKFYSSQEPKKKAEQTEGDRLKDFFFPHKNTEGCECGTWLTGSPKHSRSCKLYRDDQ